MNLQIVVKLQHEFLHQWSDCPIEDVSFLRHPHRHVLHITAKKAVTSADREIEIIMLKRSIARWLAENVPPSLVTNASCEDVAIVLTDEFNLSYCQVLEDGENGAEVHA